MPKYYVSCLDLFDIVDASNPIEACGIVSERTGVITAGMSWRVSERGFRRHTEDYIVTDILIVGWLKERYGKDGAN
jgi:hypothetical protein